MHSSRRPAVAVAAALGVVLVTAVTGCSGSSAGSSDGSTISYQVDNSPGGVKGAKALIAAFEKANPSIHVTLNPRPQGSDGDNYVKTRLSTGEMDDVFSYNSGSLLQALQPDRTLVDLSDQPWVDDLDDQYKAVVSTDAGLYGAPTGPSFAGGIMYNKKVYEQLGLSVPTDWAEFIANSEKIKDAGIAPIIQTYGDPWSSQLFVLGDFANITAQDPDWAEKYTANKAKFVDQPGFSGFEYLQEVHDKGLLNEDFASATNVQGLSMLAEGKGAQYPMTTNVIGNIAQSNPDQIDDIGVFPIPAEKASDTRLSIWEPGGLYIPKSTTGGALSAAKKFVAFANSEEGCAIQGESGTPAGPFVISTCTLPDDAPALIEDEQEYIDAGKASPALEFLSPIKGPNLDKIGVQVGSGITSAKVGAKQYDDDLVQQAQQLGISGW